MTLIEAIEKLVQDDYSIDILDYSIVYINGYFKIYTDTDTPSYWHPLGGYDDLTYQRFTSFEQAFWAVEKLIRQEEVKVAA